MIRTQISIDTLSDNISVRGQEHIPNGIRDRHGFFILWVQVLVLCSGQELVPIITKLFVLQAVMQPTVLLEHT